MSRQLYQTLSQNTKSRDITASDKRKIMEAILTFKSDEKEAFFLLIYEHYRITKKITGSIDLQNIPLPYGIKVQTNSVEFSLSKIPMKLRQIMLKFVKIVEKNRITEIG